MVRLHAPKNYAHRENQVFFFFLTNTISVIKKQLPKDLTIKRVQRFFEGIPPFHHQNHLDFPAHLL